MRRICSLRQSGALSSLIHTSSVSIPRHAVILPHSTILIRQKFDLTPPKDNPKFTHDVTLPPETFQHPEDDSVDLLGRELPPRNLKDARGGLPLHELFRPGGRASVSGVVATVFGASGFIGQDVVYHLGHIGCQVIVPYRGDGMKIRELKVAGDLGQIVPIPFDVTNEESVRATLIRSNTVVNCLGKAWETANYSFHDVHVKTTYRLCKLAKEMGVERWIQISCVGADVNSNSKLLKSKAEQEAVVRSFYPDATILRLCPVYGFNDRYLNWIATLGSRFIGIPQLLGVKQLHQPIQVQDVSKCVIAALARGESLGQIYELGGPDVFTFEGVVEIVSHSAFLNIPVMHVPEFVLKAYGRLWQGVKIKKDKNWKPWDEKGSLFLFAKLANKIDRLMDKIDFRGIISHIASPGIYNVDMVEQAKYDRIASSSANVKRITDLGIHPSSLLNNIDTYMIPFRPVGKQPDRFPNPQKLKEAAGGVSSAV